MPYSYPNDIPATIKNLPVGAQKIWIRTFNAVLSSTGSEDMARKAAWSNVKNKYHKVNGKWVKKELNHLENEIMKTIVNKTEDKGFFKTFIPLAVGDNGSYIIEKSVDGVKRKFLIGQASNLKTDREEERIGKKFLQKMKQSALGLNVFSEHEHTLEKTLGYVSDVGGDADVFIAETALEPEGENELVKQILMKLEHGTKLGYSVGGKVTEVAKIYDDNLKKDIVGLEDGEIFELSITAIPSSFDTWVTPLFKSVREIISGNDFDLEKALTHNSTLAKTEPAWSSVDKTKLPLKAFVPNKVGTDKTKKSTWGFPHHWVTGGSTGGDLGIYTSGTMYLHKGGLIAAWAAANGARSGSQAGANVKTHLNAHRKAIGLTTKQIDALSYMHKAGMNAEDIEKSANSFIDFNKSGNEQSVVGNLMIAWVAARSASDNKHISGNIGEQRQKMGISIGQMDLLAKKFIDGSLNSFELEEMIEDFQKVNEFINNESDEKQTFTELIKMLDEISESESVNDQIYDMFYSFRRAISMILFDENLEPAAKKEKINTVATEFGSKVEELSAKLAVLTQQIEEQIS